jgi:alkyl hydroperoxide reductase subunit F
MAYDSSCTEPGTVPCAFTAGDVTTIAYKQIVMAVGDGARAALGAFDWLIRN